MRKTISHDQNDLAFYPGQGLPPKADCSPLQRAVMSWRWLKWKRIRSMEMKDLESNPGQFHVFTLNCLEPSDWCPSFEFYPVSVQLALEWDQKSFLWSKKRFASLYQNNSNTVGSNTSTNIISRPWYILLLFKNIVIILFQQHTCQVGWTLDKLWSQRKQLSSSQEVHGNGKATRAKK